MKEQTKFVKLSEISHRNFLSPAPVNGLFDVRFKRNTDYFKPIGLWYSMKHYWLENLDLEYRHDLINYKIPPKPAKQYDITGRYLYEIQIKPRYKTDINNIDPNKLLVIRTVSDLNKFSKKYKSSRRTFTKLFDKIHSNLITKDTKLIRPVVVDAVFDLDWYKISKDFAGIEIPVFLKKTHTLFGKTPWYYGWDIASGNIWNMVVIDSLKLIK